MVDVYTLTANAAAQALQDNGLDALGLTTPRLSATWGSATPAFNDATLQLTPAGSAQAPFRGTLEFLDSGVEFRRVTGAPITGPVAVLRLHPQAITRLDRLLLARYAPVNQPHHHLVPESLVFTGAVPAPDRSPQTYEPGELLGRAEPMSFHDNRGLIIDPIAIAALFADLLTAFPALDASGGASTGGAGGVATIAALAVGVRVQVTDLHGNPYAALPDGPGIEQQNSGGGSVGSADASGLLTLAAGDQLAGTGDTAAARLRLGWASGGVMSAGPLTQPPLAAAVTLTRQFLRAFVVDLDWHLRGNRTLGALRGVPAEDGDLPDDLKPQVRDGITIDYLSDGPDILAHTNQVISRLSGAPGSNLLFAVAPVIDEDVGLPPAPGAPAHWPAFPGPNTGAGFAPGQTNPTAGATAVWWLP